MNQNDKLCLGEEATVKLELYSTYKYFLLGLTLMLGKFAFSYDLPFKISHK